MKAWFIEKRGTPSDLKQGEVQGPLGEVKVRVRGAALNPADLKVLKGKDGGKFLHSNRFPIVLGYDFAGTTDVGGVETEVYGFLPYSTANSQGSLAEYVAVPASSIARKPKNVGFSEAASLATASLTALMALRDRGGLGSGELASGAKVLIHGASGGVGSAAVQIAKILGAEVWATGSLEKHSFIRGLGADHVIDYKKVSLRDLKESHEGQMNLVFDVVSNSSFMECESLLADHGTYITLLPSPSLLVGVIKSLLSSKRARFVVVKSTKSNLERITQWVEEGKLKPTVEKTYSFSEMPQAFEALAAGRAKGKIAVSVS